jgi:hypothetical protein
VLIVTTLALVLGLWLAHADGITPSTPSRTPRVASTASTELVFAPTPRPESVAWYDVSDGGVFFAPVDAGPPPIATGVLGHAITARLCPRAADAICRARDRAGCDPLLPPMDESSTRCRDIVFDACARWVDQHYAAEPDAMIVSEANLAQCLTSIDDDVAGGASFDLDMACRDLGADPASEGDTCAFRDGACGHDGWCTDGVCIANAQYGEPCQDDYCGRGLACVAGLCDRPTPLGGVCDEDSVCEGRRAACLDHVCATHVADGASCTYGSDCAHGSHCAMGRCERAPGGRCDDDDACGNGNSCLGEVTARCEPRAAPGGRCVAQTDCGVGTYCDEGVCIAQMFTEHGSLAEGEVCTAVTWPGGCARGLICGATLEGGRCIVPIAIGEDCSEGPCGSDAMCVWSVRDGRCGPLLCAATDFFVEYGEE